MRDRSTLRLLAMLAIVGAVCLSRPAPAQQAIYVGASVPTLSASPASSLTMTAPAGIQSGDFLIAYVTQNSAYLSINSAPSGWTLYQWQNQTPLGMAVYYKSAGSTDVGGSTSYSWTFAVSGGTAGAILAFRGLTTGYQIAAASIQGNGASTSRTAPSVTPNTPDTMLVTLYAAGNGSADAMTAPSGMTQALDAATGGGSSGALVSAYYQMLTASSATGNRTASSSSGISAVSIGATLALIPRVGTPLAQWHFDQSQWTGAAGEVTDSGGSGYNGVAMHGATTASTTPAIGATTSGTCGYGTLSGSTQYVQMPSSLPHVGNTFTVTAWIRPTSYANGRIWIDDENYDGYALSFGDGTSGYMRFFHRSPSLQILDAYAPLNLNQWYFIAGVMDTASAQTMSLYVFDSNGNLVNLNSLSANAFSAGSGANAGVGGNLDAAVEGPVIRFQGNIDEVTVYPIALTYNGVVAASQLTHSCAAGSVAPNHYAVTTPGTAVNCQAAPVTINAHSANHAVITTTDTVTLSTSTAHGDWTLTSGNGTFTAGSSNSGTATYAFNASDAGSAVFALRDMYAEAVTINVSDGTASAISGTATASEDAPLTFVSSGFRVTTGANIATSIGTQRSGLASTQSLALQAVRTDTSTGACTTAFASGQTANISVAYQCNNPASCVNGQSFTLTNNGTSTGIAGNPASGVSTYTSVPMKFSTANAEAPFTINYSDAGQVTLYFRYAIPLGNGSSSGNLMLGSGQFVVQPYALALSGINRTSDGFGNPAAGTASGTVFINAGRPFTATVTAWNYLGNATPNFGQELSPAAVTLTSSLVVPATGHDPAVSGSFGTYTGGTATGTAFSWPEVGIVTLTPSVANYLGSGTVTGTTSGNVGRFVPNAFAIALNTPVFATACAAGNFTYVGQPFTYAVAPLISVTAQALGGATTQNYTGSLMRMTGTSLTGRTYTPTPASPALSLSGLPATTADPAISDLGSGQVALTFSAGSGLAFSRGGAIAPFTANISLSENVIDLDGVSATNPVTFGAGSGIAFSSGASQYYGRLAVADAVGSELLDLPVAATTQYYVSGTAGFATNTSDSCSSAPLIAFSNYQQNLTAGAVCVRDSGKPGASGSGCATAAANRYDATAVGGSFNLILSAPGSGHYGAVTVTASAPSWLQYLWNAASGSASNPWGIATFGAYSGTGRRVHQREVY